MFRLRAHFLTLSRNYSGQRLKRRRIVIQRPEPEDLQTRVFKAVTEPVLPPVIQTEVDRYLLNLERRSNREVNQYEEFLMRETLKTLDRNEKEIVVFVSALWHKKRERREYQALIKPMGFEVVEHQCDVARKAILNTKYLPLSELFKWSTLCLVGSKEPSKVAGALGAMRRFHFLNPMSALLENRILTRDDLIEYTQLPPIGQLHAEAIGTLIGRLASPVDVLSSCQYELIGLLNARREQLATKDSTSVATNANSAATASS